MTGGQSERAKLIRFIAVGGTFSAIYAVVTAALINFAAAPPFWTSVIVYAVCIPAAFWVQKTVTFQADNLRRGALGYYAATQVTGIALVSLVTTRFVTYNWALDTGIMGITVALSALLNFLIGRYFTFR